MDVWSSCVGATYTVVWCDIVGPNTRPTQLLAVYPPSDQGRFFGLGYTAGPDAITGETPYSNGSWDEYAYFDGNFLAADSSSRYFFHRGPKWTPGTNHSVSMERKDGLWKFYVDGQLAWQSATKFWYGKTASGSESQHPAQGALDVNQSFIWMTREDKFSSWYGVTEMNLRPTNYPHPGCPASFNPSSPYGPVLSIGGFC